MRHLTDFAPLGKDEGASFFCSTVSGAKRDRSVAKRRSNSLKTKKHNYFPFFIKDRLQLSVFNDSLISLTDEKYSSKDGATLSHAAVDYSLRREIDPRELERPRAELK
jgi:hypothetical protein